jgi:hypothetical protein
MEYVHDAEHDVLTNDSEHGTQMVATPVRKTRNAAYYSLRRVRVPVLCIATLIT